MIIIILLITVTTFASNNIRPAYAHITKQFGNITIEVGWSNEPPLAGELNNVIVDVNKTRSGGNSSAVINALADMNILVKYGGVTKTLDFEPSEQAEGLYESKIIPTRVGSYGLVLNGTIQGQNISSAEIALDDVEGKQKLSFPDSSGSSSGSEEGTSSSNNNNIGPKISGAISQLATDVDSTKDSIDTLAKNNIDMQKSLQDIKNGADRSYMTGMVGIGAGAAGIVLAAVALSRR